MTTTTAGLSIGEVARRTGLSAHTVRFYEREGLMADPVERVSGRRVFSVPAAAATRIADLDIYADGGELTALDKQAQADVPAGELNLTFTATAGEPIVAAIGVLPPAQ